MTAAALPAWPEPRVTRLAHGHELASWLLADDGRVPSHLACVVDEAPRKGAKDRALRLSMAKAFAGLIWAPEEVSRPDVVVLDLGDSGELHALGSLWSGSSAYPTPYVVFDDAQLALSRLPAELAPPGRIACIKSAALILGEAVHATRIDSLVSRRLMRELLSPMASLESVSPTLVSSLLPLMRVFVPALRAQHSVRLFELECALVPAVVAMERAGLFFDTSAFGVLVRAWQEERDAISRLDGAASSQSVNEAAALATPPTGPSTERAAREALPLGGESESVPAQDDDATEQAHADATGLRSRLARLDKLLSTYAHWGSDFVASDGRIRCTLSPMATESGRFSCSRPNLQQVPSQHTAPGFRDCFKAPRNAVLIIADYAQIELRVAAQLAPDEYMRQVFREGRDPHRAMGAAMTGKPESEITSHERKLAKAINFGFLFGMGAARFAQYAESSYGLSLSLEQAQEAKEDFLRMFPGIADWHQRTKRLTRNTHEVTVRTAMGRLKRFAPQQMSFSAALNIPVQGTAAEGFKFALIELHRELPALGARGVLCVHDEFLAEAPVAQALEARALVVECMERGMQRVLPDVPVAVDARIAESWGGEPIA